MVPCYHLYSCRGSKTLQYRPAILTDPHGFIGSHKSNRTTVVDGFVIETDKLEKSAFLASETDADKERSKDRNIILQRDRLISVEIYSRSR